MTESIEETSFPLRHSVDHRRPPWEFHQTNDGVAVGFARAVFDEYYGPFRPGDRVEVNGHLRGVIVNLEQAGMLLVPESSMHPGWWIPAAGVMTIKPLDADVLASRQRSQIVPPETSSSRPEEAERHRVEQQWAQGFTGEALPGTMNPPPMQPGAQ